MPSSRADLFLLCDLCRCGVVAPLVLYSILFITRFYMQWAPFVVRVVWVWRIRCTRTGWSRCWVCRQIVTFSYVRVLYSHKSYHLPMVLSIDLNESTQNMHLCALTPSVLRVNEDTQQYKHGILYPHEVTASRGRSERANYPCESTIAEIFARAASTPSSSAKSSR